MKNRKLTALLLAISMGCTPAAGTLPVHAAESQNISASADEETVAETVAEPGDASESVSEEVADETTTGSEDASESTGEVTVDETATESEAASESVSEETADETSTGSEETSESAGEEATDGAEEAQTASTEETAPAEETVQDEQVESDTNVSGDWTYGKNDDGTLYIAKYTGNATAVVIPDTLDGTRVTAIGSGAFAGNQTLESVTIPEGISIEGSSSYYNGAFYNCTALKSVKLSSRLKSIGENAFYGCSSLTQIDLPEGLEELGGGCFSKTGLTSIRIPSTLKDAWFPFTGLQCLTQATLSDGLTAIPATLFANTGLTSITIPDTVTAIEGNSANYNGAFYNCTALKSVTFGSGLKEIGANAFNGCIGLLDVYFNSGLESVADYQSDTNVFAYPEDITAHVYADTYAYSYAQDKKMKIVLRTGDDTPVTTNTFTIGVDNNSYYHNNGSGDGFENELFYRVSSDQMGRLFDLSGQSGLWSVYNLLMAFTENWGGSCYGVSNTMAMVFDDIMDLDMLSSTAGLPKYYSLPRPVDDIKELNCVNYFMMSQHVPGLHAGQLAAATTDMSADATRNFLKQLVKTTGSGDVSVLCYFYKVPNDPDVYGHAIVATDSAAQADGSYIVHLYDLNSYDGGNPGGHISDMTVSSDFSTFSFTDGNGDLITNESGKATCYGMDLIDKSGMQKLYDTLENESSTVSEQVNADSAAAADPTVITLGLGDPVTLVNSDGETLTFDGVSYSGTMPVTDSYRIYNDADSKLVLTTDPKDQCFTVTSTSDGKSMDVWISDDDDFQSVAGSGIDSATMDLDNTMTLKGTDYTFASSVATESGDLVNVSGTADGDVTLTSEEDAVSVAPAKTVKNTKTSVTTKTGKSDDADVGTIESEKSVTDQNTIRQAVTNGWYEENGQYYWYEDGVRQGTSSDQKCLKDGNGNARGREIYDSASNAWYWLDAGKGGAKAVNCDVFIPYYDQSDPETTNNQNGNPDAFGKWVRYDENGQMVIGRSWKDGNEYYFDPQTGAMAHGVCAFLDTASGQVAYHVYDYGTGIKVADTASTFDFWYEDGVLQGVTGRGKEIFSPVDQQWYWLDSVFNGKKAVSKEVMMPYTYNGQDTTPKWVRYDDRGAMIKGWYTNENGTYYYDPDTGAMTKGWRNIDGTNHHFDETTGIMD